MICKSVKLAVGNVGRGRYHAAKPPQGAVWMRFGAALDDPLSDHTQDSIFRRHFEGKGP